MGSCSQNWGDGRRVDVEDGIRVCEEYERDFPLLSELGEREPVWEAVFAVCFVVRVAPFSW